MPAPLVAVGMERLKMEKILNSPDTTSGKFSPAIVITFGYSDAIVT
jgi:hypothetical protein